MNDEMSKPEARYWDGVFPDEFLDGLAAAGERLWHERLLQRIASLPCAHNVHCKSCPNAYCRTLRCLANEAVDTALRNRIFKGGDLSIAEGLSQVERRLCIKQLDAMGCGEFLTAGEKAILRE